MSDSTFTIAETIQLLNMLAHSKNSVQLDEEKQTLNYVDTDDLTWAFALPLSLPAIFPGSTEDILLQIERAAQTYTIILIQAGAAALGHYVRGELTNHKVIKKYMVRKSQGKSQIKFLKSKGKSRLGSRIRLKNSISFFEEINATLTEWDIVEQSEAILLAVPINLKNLLFTSNVQPPFEKKDPRIKKIPIDIKVPSLKELKHINWLATRGSLKRT